MMLAASAHANAADEYTFTTPTGSELRFHHKTMTRSLQNKQVVVTAYWTMLMPDKTAIRFKVDVTGCADNSGTVTSTVVGYDKVTQNVWVGDGLTVYDHVAEAQCIFWGVLSLPPK